MSDLRIIGAGGHGKVVADTAEAGCYDAGSFLGKVWPERDSNGCWQMIGQPGDIGGQKFCAVGNNATRSRLFDALDLHDGPVLTHCLGSRIAEFTIGRWHFSRGWRGGKCRCKGGAQRHLKCGVQRRPRLCAR